MPMFGHTSVAVCTPSSLVGAQQRLIWAYLGPLPPASAYVPSTSSDGEVDHRPSPISAATRAAAGPNAETITGGGVSGWVYRRAFSTVKYVPAWSTVSPVHNRR